MSHPYLTPPFRSPHDACPHHKNKHGKVTSRWKQTSDKSSRFDATGEFGGRTQNERTELRRRQRRRTKAANIIIPFSFARMQRGLFDKAAISADGSGSYGASRRSVRVRGVIPLSRRPTTDITHHWKRRGRGHVTRFKFWRPNHISGTTRQILRTCWSQVMKLLALGRQSGRGQNQVTHYKFYTSEIPLERLKLETLNFVHWQAI